MRRFALRHLALVAAGGLLAAACAEDTTPQAPPGPDGTTPDVPSPWIHPIDEAASPTLDAATRGLAVEETLALAMELDPDTIQALHEALYPTPPIGTGDLTACPAFLTYDYGEATSFFWQGECTDLAGTRFSGFGFASHFARFPSEFGPLDGAQLFMSGRIEAADGTFLEGSGSLNSLVVDSPQIAGSVRGIDGTFAAGGPRAPASPWLDGSRHPSISVVGWTWLATGGRNLTFEGAIGLPDHPTVTAVAFEGVTVREQAAGATCEDEPGGLASVRGVDGYWYDILFHGPTDEEPTTPAADCDGCGDTWFRGRDVGPTCVDITTIFTWPGAP